jgi:hypothetical protein
MNGKLVIERAERLSQNQSNKRKLGRTNRKVFTCV